MSSTAISRWTHSSLSSSRSSRRLRVSTSGRGTSSRHIWPCLRLRPCRLSTRRCGASDARWRLSGSNLALRAKPHPCYCALSVSEGSRRSLAHKRRSGCLLQPNRISLPRRCTAGAAVVSDRVHPTSRGVRLLWPSGTCSSARESLSRADPFVDSVVRPTTAEETLCHSCSSSSGT